MIDHIHSITLVLEQDLREDDAEALISACRLLRNVVTVIPNVELRRSWWEALDALDKRNA